MSFDSTGDGLSPARKPGLRLDGYLNHLVLVLDLRNLDSLLDLLHHWDVHLKSVAAPTRNFSWAIMVVSLVSFRNQLRHRACFWIGTWTTSSSKTTCGTSTSFVTVWIMGTCTSQI